MDFDEFVAIMTQQSAEAEDDKEEEMKEIIRIFDIEGKGYISSTDLELVLKRHGSLTEHDFQEMFTKLNPSGDGMIQYQG